MPGQNRNETFVLKHRLTGAAILIGFAVVVLPLLLGGPGDGGDEGPGGASGDSDTQVFHSNITPIGGATPPRVSKPDTDVAGASALPSGAGQAQADEPPTDEPPAEEPRATSAQPGDQGEDETEDQAAAEEARNQSAAPEQTASASGEAAAGESGKRVERGWIVQVGTFRNPDNVDKLVAKLQESGFESSTTEVETSQGSATRVWVGPFETRVEAARTKTRVKQRTGSEGLIVAYP